MTATEIAKEMLEDLRYSSMTRHVLRHKLFPQLQAMGNHALPDLFTLLKEEHASPHIMAMIANVTSSKIEIPEQERGHVKAMVKRYLDWGRENGYTS